MRFGYGKLKLMKVAISSFPLESGHKDRGIGSYTRNLIDALRRYSDVEVIEFSGSIPSEKVDLVHLTWFDLFFKTLTVSKYPTVVTIHDVIPLKFSDYYPAGLRGKVNLFWQKQALKKVAKIITVSEISKNDISKYLNIPEEKIRVTFEGIDDAFKVMSKSQSDKVKNKYDLSDSFLVYVGDANYVKNLPFLIKGFKKIKETKATQGMKLVLVGGVFTKVITGNHPELESLREVHQLIKEFNFENDILMPGYVNNEDLAGFYNLATLYIQPSLYEGFGLPVLEAMSCGTPVISSSGGSLPEIGGKATLYFDPTDQADFISKLTEVLQNSSLRDKLSSQGLVRAKEFSWQKVADKTVKAYLEATS